jgi:class 3 adenylate cyclase
VAQVLQTRVAREATVLFIDIKGFTAGCAEMTVAQVVYVRM